MIAFRCPGCRRSLEADDSDAGKVVNCDRCSQAITLPDPKTPKPALPPEDEDEGDDVRTVRITVAGDEDEEREKLEGFFVFSFVVGGICLAVVLFGKVMEWIAK